MKYVWIYLLFLVGCMSPAVECYDDACTEAEEITMKSGLASSNQLTPGVPSKVALLQTGPIEAGNWTVQFSINDPNGANLIAGDVVRARAEVNWMVAGQVVRRVFDCNDGTSISGNAEQISVRVVDNSVIAGGSVVRPYDVFIQTSPGNRPSVQQPPTYSLDVIQLSAGIADQIVDIPDNIGATALHVGIAPLNIGTAIGAYDVLVKQASTSLTLLSSCDPRQSEWITLVPGATKIQFVQGAAAPTTLWTPSFSIDG